LRLQQLKRRHVAATAQRLVRARAAQEYSEYMHAQAAMDDDWWEYDDSQERDLTCRACSGTGGDPWNDGITPCERCDGEGYQWWN
jgi:hypothetical protein